MQPADATAGARLPGLLPGLWEGPPLSTVGVHTGLQGHGPTGYGRVCCVSPPPPPESPRIPRGWWARRVDAPAVAHRGCGLSACCSSPPQARGQGPSPVPPAHSSAPLSHAPQRPMAGGAELSVSPFLPSAECLEASGARGLAQRPSAVVRRAPHGRVLTSEGSGSSERWCQVRLPRVCAVCCSTGSCWLLPRLIRTWADCGVPIGPGSSLVATSARTAVLSLPTFSCPVPSLWWASPLHVGASGLPAGGCPVAGVWAQLVCGCIVFVGPVSGAVGCRGTVSPSTRDRVGSGPSPPVVPLETLLAVGRQVVRGKPWDQLLEAGSAGRPPGGPPGMGAASLTALGSPCPDVCPLGACLWWPWGRPCSLVLGWPWPWEGLLASRARSVPSLLAEHLLSADHTRPSASVGPAPSRGADRWLGRQVPDEAVRSAGGAGGH